MKGLRVPERIFAIVMWLVSIAFAGFLIGLGGRILADLPKLDAQVDIESFVADRQDLARIRRESNQLEAEQQLRQEAQARHRLALTNAGNAYAAAQAQFDNWTSTRQATTDPAQDPEVLRRTRELDRLKAEERAAQVVMENEARALLTASQALDANRRRQSELFAAAQTGYQRALFWQELRVFGIRLALTLPLLVLAGYLAAKKRKTDYWPLMRGVVIFGVFTFFVELVPYLPSYGGYVRYGVGVIATAIAGHYVIRAMRRYLAKRQEVERQTEQERRQSLAYEDALKKMKANVCPGCERPIHMAGQTPSNYCVHCGMMLFDDCTACHTHKNVFFQYCPSCGTAKG